MSATIIIRTKRRRAIRRFREAGITSPARATFCENLGIRWSWPLNKLIRRGVLVDVGDGRYYLDEEAAQQYERDVFQRSIMMLIATLIFLFVMLMFWLLT